MNDCAYGESEESPFREIRMLIELYIHINTDTI